MTVTYLIRRPPHDPKGLDGRGWNRVGLYNTDLSGDECALKPRSLAQLWVSWYRPLSARSGYSGYGPCIQNGACGDCPVVAARWRQLDRHPADRVLVRVEPRDHIDQPWGLLDPDHAWNRPGSERWSWQELAGLEGWCLAGRYRHYDTHGPGSGSPAPGRAPIPPPHTTSAPWRGRSGSTAARTGNPTR